MAVVDHRNRIVAVGEIADVIEICDRAVHRKDAIGHNQLFPTVGGVFQVGSGQKTIQTRQHKCQKRTEKQSWPESGKTPGWVYNDNNWNQVCNAGMIAASIVVAEIEPDLAAKTIYRSIDGLNNALRSYAPDGVYPEGAVYWGYGTQFTVVTAAIFESAFGTDFGIADFPGFKESAVFRVMSTAPSGRLFNYADCAEEPERYTDFTLSWFAVETGNKVFLNEEKFMLPVEERDRISRLAGAGLVWTAQFEEKQNN